MRGDTLTLECQPASELSGDSVSDEDFSWTAEREGMLGYSNVIVEGETITIRDVRVENTGEYKCFKVFDSDSSDLRKGVPLRALTLSVLALPQFHIIFLPAYDTERECRYKDLLTVNSGLAAEMEAAACAQQKLCTIRVDEPSCLKSREGSFSLLRVIGVMSTVQHWGSGVIRCSAQCRRDLHCSLAYLCASAIPPLKEVDLIVAGAGHNRTVPAISAGGRKWIVTHTLKRKGVYFY
ncbi:hypothetical protein EVAR_62105_1 [Eumeta japonica]|uniref:Ig-like domain-containing protein n=1 Tax=Eumeta variegata TaxID=151549 RepID=A0A4C1Z383_EUMVA|nr:hypothetical protein EVAR_62105_1 [Eumeta japonica]